MQAKAVVEWLGDEMVGRDFFIQGREAEIIYDEDMKLLVSEDVSDKFATLREKWIGCQVSKFTLDQISHAFTDMLRQYREAGILFLNGEMMPPASNYYLLQHKEDSELYNEYFYYSYD